MILLCVTLSAVILPPTHESSPQGVQSCMQHVLLMAAKFTPWLRRVTQLLLCTIRPKYVGVRGRAAQTTTR